MAVDYRRRVSTEEAREGYLLIEKARPTFFPKPGETFSLDDRGTARQATIESYDCECRGPEKPHQHYFLRAPGLVAGESWKVRQDPKGYHLERD